MGWNDMVGGSPYPVPTNNGTTDWWKYQERQQRRGTLGDIGAGFTGLAQFFGGQREAPRQTGWDWQSYSGGYGPGGNDLNPYTEAWEGLTAKMASRGGGGYFDEWQSNVMNPLTKMVSELTANRGQLLQQQVQGMVNPALEGALSQYGISGAAGAATAATIGQSALAAQSQAEGDKLNMLSALGQQTYQGGLQALLQGGQLYGQAERVAPTLTPVYEEEKKSPFADFMSNLSAIAGAVTPILGLFI